MNKHFHIITFGCQMNVHDSRWLAQSLEKKGYTESPLETAQIAVINTCSVRKKPEEKVYATIARLDYLLKNKTNALIVVAGCVAQQLGNELFKKSPLVRLVLGTDNLHEAPKYIEELLAKPQENLCHTGVLSIIPERPLALEKIRADERSQAFVTIMQGCDNFCAYCIVPFVRGRQKSRTNQAVIDECQERILAGAKEITLLGQNVNSFGLDGKSSNEETQKSPSEIPPFVELLQKLVKLEGLERLSMMTPHPKDLHPKLIELYATEAVLSSHFHLPLQAGSDRILQSMSRRYTKEHYLSLVQELRKARPHLALTTDIIVGFPGETEEDFQQTLACMREAKFSSSFSFYYSDRPQAAAVNFPDKIPLEVQHERLLRLQALQEELTADWLRSCVGRETKLLLQKPSKKALPQESPQEESWQGRDEWNNAVHVLVPKELAIVGNILPVQIKSAKRHSLTAQIISDTD